MGISCQSHDSIHLKILPTSLEVFSRDLFYFIRKAFNKAFDKLTNLQILNTILTLDSKETFLRILNFWSLNIQFNYFLSVMPQSYSEKKYNNSSLSKRQTIQDSGLFQMSCINHLFIIGIYSMQRWTAITKHGVTKKKKNHKKIKAYRKYV